MVAQVEEGGVGTKQVWEGTKRYEKEIFYCEPSYIFWILNHVNMYPIQNIN